MERFSASSATAARFIARHNWRRIEAGRAAVSATRLAAAILRELGGDTIHSNELYRAVRCKLGGLAKGRFQRAIRSLLYGHHKLERTEHGYRRRSR